ncbi:MAG: hypothetical protein HUJ22_02970 [Gracilimonas sp.]|nr:hypothetical protein [Gracilimonas sp.]
MLCVSSGVAQNFYSAQNFVPQNYSLKQAFDDTLNNDTTFPDPKKVLRQSLIVPGWGQITNKQIWKVPIVYGVLGGLTYYSIYLNNKYQGYRAAYYNLNPDTPDDNRFGPTPDYIPENVSLEALRQSRNNFHNQRDLSFVYIGLAYALNAIDAYVFAHLRSFDVSDDLSMRVSMKPDVLTTAYSSPAPSISFSVKF